MLRSTRPILILALLLALPASGPFGCFGQAFMANLTGLVTDPSGAAVPMANLKLLNTDIQEERQTTASEAGRYTFSQLLPGNYELTVTAAGFRTSVQHNIVLIANQSAAVNLALQLGEITQRIDISEAAVHLDTQTANQSTTITRSMVASLPTNTRNPMTLVFAQVGAVSVAGVNQGAMDQNYGRIGLNGQRDLSSEVLLDGVRITAGTNWNGLMYSPAVDSVQEIQVSRNTYDAQFGRSAGGVISLVSKGGSSQFHGTAFELLENSALNANAWANNRTGQPKPMFQRNAFGGNFSGPIWRTRRVFFFAGYEGFRQGTPLNSTVSLPTGLERQGSFSQSFNPNGTLSLIYNPFTTRPHPSGSGHVRDAFPNNVIPASMLDPVGVRTVALYPEPNTPGLPYTHANNYTGAGKKKIFGDRIDVRVDWAHNEKHSLYARLSRTLSQGSEYPANLWWSYTNSYGAITSSQRYQAVLGNTLMLSPTFVVNVQVGNTDWTEMQRSHTYGQDGASIGLPASIVSQFQVKTIPLIMPANYSNISSSRDVTNTSRVDNVQVNATKELSAHSIRFGFSWESAKLNGGAIFSANFNFTRGLTSGPTAATNSTVSGNSIASLLLGVGSSGNAPINALAASNRLTYGGYIQDSWRVTRRLTLNPGLRYEVQRPPTDRFDRGAVVDYGVVNPLGAQVGLPLRGGLIFLSGGNRFPWDTYRRGFAPRLGLAYKISDKLVFRGGYGIFYPLNRASNSLAGYSSDTPWVSTVGGNGIIPQNLLRNPFPQGLIQPIGSSLGLATNLGLGIGSYERNFPLGYVQNYSGDFQYGISPSTVVQIGYAGNQGRKLGFGLPINDNQLRPSLLSQGATLDRQVANPFYGFITSGSLAARTIAANQLLRPFPHFTSVTRSAEIPGGSSGYNALVLQIRHQFSAGLMLIAGYQWSKAIDNLSEDEPGVAAANFRDYTNTSLERAISAHDVPQSFTASFVYDLPVGKGKQFAALPGAANFLLGGWQLSGVLRFQSGLPFEVTAPSTISQYGFGAQFPNVCGGCNVSLANPTPDKWFNTAAFVLPGPYTLGSLSRRLNQLRFGPMRNLDLGVMKNWRPREPLRVQFRAEFYNLPNHPQFGQPNATVGSPTFGLVTSTFPEAPARTVQFGLRIDF